jgi:hypothetical protein
LTCPTPCGVQASTPSPTTVLPVTLPASGGNAGSPGVSPLVPVAAAVAIAGVAIWRTRRWWHG